MNFTPKEFLNVETFVKAMGFLAERYPGILYSKDYTINPYSLFQKTIQADINPENHEPKIHQFSFDSNIIQEETFNKNGIKSVLTQNLDNLIKAFKDNKLQNLTADFKALISDPIFKDKDFKAFLRIAPLLYKSDGSLKDLTSKDKTLSDWKESGYPTALNDILNSGSDFDRAYTDYLKGHIEPLIKPPAEKTAIYQKAYAEVIDQISKEHTFSNKIGKNNITRHRVLRDVPWWASYFVGNIKEVRDCSVKYGSLSRALGRCYFYEDLNDPTHEPLGYVFVLPVNTESSPDNIVPFIATVNGQSLNASDVEGITKAIGTLWESEIVLVPDMHKNPGLTNFESIVKGTKELVKKYSQERCEVALKLPAGFDEADKILNGENSCADKFKEAIPVHIPDKIELKTEQDLSWSFNGFDPKSLPEIERTYLALLCQHDGNTRDALGNEADEPGFDETPDNSNNIWGEFIKALQKTLVIDPTKLSVLTPLLFGGGLKQREIIAIQKKFSKLDIFTVIGRQEVFNLAATLGNLCTSHHSNNVRRLNTSIIKKWTHPILGGEDSEYVKESILNLTIYAYKELWRRYAQLVNAPEALQDRKREEIDTAFNHLKKTVVASFVADKVIQLLLENIKKPMTIDQHKCALTTLVDHLNKLEISQKNTGSIKKIGLEIEIQAREIQSIEKLINKSLIHPNQDVREIALEYCLKKNTYDEIVQKSSHPIEILKTVIFLENAREYPGIALAKLHLNLDNQDQEIIPALIESLPNADESSQEKIYGFLESFREFEIDQKLFDSLTPLLTYQEETIRQASLVQLLTDKIVFTPTKIMLDRITTEDCSNECFYVAMFYDSQYNLGLFDHKVETALEMCVSANTNISRAGLRILNHEKSTNEKEYAKSLVNFLTSRLYKRIDEAQYKKIQFAIQQLPLSCWDEDIKNIFCVLLIDGAQFISSVETILLNLKPSEKISFIETLHTFIDKRANQKLPLEAIQSLLILGLDSNKMLKLLTPYYEDRKGEAALTKIEEIFENVSLETTITLYLNIPEKNGKMLEAFKDYLLPKLQNAPISILILKLYRKSLLIHSKDLTNAIDHLFKTIDPGAKELVPNLVEIIRNTPPWRVVSSIDALVKISLPLSDTESLKTILEKNWDKFHDIDILQKIEYACGREVTHYPKQVAEIYQYIVLNSKSPFDFRLAVFEKLIKYDSLKSQITPALVFDIFNNTDLRFQQKIMPLIEKSAYISDALVSKILDSLNTDQSLHYGPGFYCNEDFQKRITQYCLDNPTIGIAKLLKIAEQREEFSLEALNVLITVCPKLESLRLIALKQLEQDRYAVSYLIPILHKTKAYEHPKFTDIITKKLVQGLEKNGYASNDFIPLLELLSFAEKTESKHQFMILPFLTFSRQNYSENSRDIRLHSAKTFKKLFDKEKPDFNVLIEGATHSNPNIRYSALILLSESDGELTQSMINDLGKYFETETGGIRYAILTLLIKKAPADKVTLKCATIAHLDNFHRELLAPYYSTLELPNIINQFLDDPDFLGKTLKAYVMIAEKSIKNIQDHISDAILKINRVTPLTLQFLFKALTSSMPPYLCEDSFQPQVLAKVIGEYNNGLAFLVDIVDSSAGKQQDNLHQEVAVATLKILGKSAQIAVPAILRLLQQSTSECTKDFCISALEKIGGLTESELLSLVSELPSDRKSIFHCLQAFELPEKMLPLILEKLSLDPTAFQWRITDSDKLLNKFKTTPPLSSLPHLIKLIATVSTITTRDCPTLLTFFSWLSKMKPESSIILNTLLPYVLNTDWGKVSNLAVELFKQTMPNSDTCLYFFKTALDEKRINFNQFLTAINTFQFGDDARDFAFDYYINEEGKQYSSRFYDADKVLQKIYPESEQQLKACMQAAIQNPSVREQFVTSTAKLLQTATPEIIRVSLTENKQFLEICVPYFKKNPVLTSCICMPIRDVAFQYLDAEILCGNYFEPHFYFPNENEFLFALEALNQVPLKATDLVSVSLSDFHSRLCNGHFSVKEPAKISALTLNAYLRFETDKDKAAKALIDTFLDQNSIEIIRQFSVDYPTEMAAAIHDKLKFSYGGYYPTTKISYLLKVLPTFTLPESAQPLLTQLFCDTRLAIETRDAVARVLTSFKTQIDPEKISELVSVFKTPSATEDMHLCAITLLAPHAVTNQDAFDALIDYQPLNDKTKNTVADCLLQTLENPDFKPNLITELLKKGSHRKFSMLTVLGSLPSLNNKYNIPLISCLMDCQDKNRDVAHQLLIHHALSLKPALEALRKDLNTDIYFKAAKIALDWMEEFHCYPDSLEEIIGVLNASIQFVKRDKERPALIPIHSKLDCFPPKTAAQTALAFHHKNGNVATRRGEHLPENYPINLGIFD